MANEEKHNITKYIFREANLPEPTEKVDKQTKRVKWGDDNLQPQFLNRLYYENPVHCGIINQKVKFITAGGVSIEGGDETILEDYNLTDVISSVTRDLEIGECFFYHFKKNIGTGKWSVEEMDYELVRVSEEDYYFDYSQDWSKKQQGDNEGFRRIKNIQYVTDEDTECLMRVMTRSKQRNFDEAVGLTANYYPAPNYSGAITDILSSIEMSFFTYSEVVNGWKGGTLINLANGAFKSKDDRRRAERELKIEATNRNTQGGMILTSSDGKDRAPEISQINGNDLDKRYEQAKKTARDNIMVAHGVISPALFGIFTESMFGSKEEMETAYLLFKENYVEVRQRQIIEPLNWALRKLNDFTGEIIFNDYTPSIIGEANIDEDNVVAEAINKMSPLVATKVLNNLTPNEIRALGKLKPVEGGDELPKPTASEFAKQEVDAVISEFAKVGVPRSSRKVEFSKQYDTYEDNEEEFKALYKKSKFETELTENQKVILTMISNGESYGAIKKALDISSNDLSNELVKLGSMELLDGWDLTERGKDLTVTETELEILYSYEVKPGLGGEVIPGTRDFCRTLIELDRLYTRQEIEQISIAVDRDVWSYRGGWYHNPDTGRNTPSCRHTWMQNITVKL